jgi:hypothetical protein
MGLTFLTGYVLGQHGAQSAKLASEASRGSGPSKSDLLDIHDRVDRLLLVVDAMWSLLEENGYTEEQLKDRIEQIDASDGVVDGRRRPRSRPCRECGSMVPAESESCQFCGTVVPGKDDHPLTGI